MRNSAADTSPPASAPMDNEIPVDQIVDLLEEDIVFGYLHPRERLIEDDLCSRFNTTRHMVRQALNELENTGLIERRRNVGAFVRAYTEKEVIDLYVVRDTLEASAAQRIVFPVSAERLQRLIDIQGQHDRAAESDDLRAAFRANIAFHQVLFALTDNPILSGAIDDFARRAHVVRFLSMADARFLQKARDDHWKIIHALQEQDRDSLVTMCRSHLVPSRDAYLEQNRRRNQFKERSDNRVVGL